ncbi:OmpH family outer membrane protein [Gymnodinialimonas hymeniacidonis]|uniref:OmpH family outer membrane protein n=1 Tax=Gymnodinialimonas hymeniacidonis TaxID=3126508 RepID=UPI0034C604CF
MGSLANGLCAAALGLAALAFAAPATAQTGPARNDVLVLNQERLLNQTAYGARIQQELEEASIALAAENRQIEELLTAEELELTDLRQTLPADEFRVLADEFDTRVSAIRAAQDAKTRDLQAQAEAARQRFFEETVPILLELVEGRGASVLMDSRTVLLSAGGVDITEAAIVVIDERLGRGGEDPLIAIPGLSSTPQED